MFSLSSIKYNIYFVYITHFLTAFSASWGVIQMIFYKDIGLTFIEISTVLSISTISALIFEVPTGVFTDLYGRKKSLTIAFILSALAGFILIGADTLYEIMFVAVLYGLSFAFWSGSYEALLYESLEQLGKAEQYTKVLSRANFIFVSLGVLTNYLTPIIYEMDMRYPFYIAAALEALLIVLATQLKETEKQKHKRVIKHEFINQIKFSFKFIVKRKNLLFIFLYGSIWVSTLGIFGGLLNQPLVYEQYDLKQYGIIFSMTTLTQSIIIFNTDRILKIMKRSNPYLVLVLAWALCLAMMVEFAENLYFLIPIMGISWAVGTLSYVLISNDLNHIIDDDEIRASVLSFYSMARSTFLTIGFFVMANIMELYNNAALSTLALSLYTIVAGLIVLMAYPKKNISY